MFKLVNEDCLTAMKNIPDCTVDMILCDLPYSSKRHKTTWNKWDKEIDIDKLWEQYNRIIKPNGVIALFATNLFSAKLIMSNAKNYKYKWVWEKPAGTGFLNAKKMPLNNFEEILIFCKGKAVYNPQMREGTPYTAKKGSKSSNYCNSDKIVTTINKGGRYPVTVLKFNRDKKHLHSTQKPTELCSYLIKTYTNEGDLVLDNCMGSGTTGKAAVVNKRDFIGIDIDTDCFNVAQKEIMEAANGL